MSKCVNGCVELGEIKYYECCDCCETLCETCMFQETGSNYTKICEYCPQFICNECYDNDPSWNFRNEHKCEQSSFLDDYEKDMLKEKESEEAEEAANLSWISDTNNPTISIPYPRGNNNDITITYLILTVKLPKNSKTLPREVTKNSNLFPKSAQEKELQVVTEDLGHILSLRNCSLYLHMTFPNRDFSDAEIRKCFDIFLLIAQKAGGYECINDMRTDFFYDVNKYSIPGLFTIKRKTILEDLFQGRYLIFLSYDPIKQEDKEWIDLNDVKNKLEHPKILEYPTFSLKELLQCEKSYKIFLDFWANLPDHEQVRDIFRALGLPRDIINYIFKRLRI